MNTTPETSNEGPVADTDSARTVTSDAAPYSAEHLENTMTTTSEIDVYEFGYVDLPEDADLTDVGDYGIGLSREQIDAFWADDGNKALKEKMGRDLLVVEDTMRAELNPDGSRRYSEYEIFNVCNAVARGAL